MKFIFDQKGFSLVEVLIASGIGVAIFFYLNQSLIQIQETQRNIERRDDVNQVRRFLDRHLSDYRSWRDNPEQAAPTSQNSSNLFFYPTPRSSIRPLAYSRQSFNSFWQQAGRPAIDCPDEYPGCRIAMFDYQGQLLDKNEMGQRGTSNLFLVFISIETPSESVSRSYVPHFKVSVSDTAQRRSGLLDRQFHVNTSESLRPGGKTVAYYEGEYVDSIARKDCFLRFVEKYPQNSSMGHDLCKRARSSAPAECFEKMKDRFKVSDPVAMVTCSSAINMTPYHCYSEASSLRTSEFHRAILCHQALSLNPVECAQKIIDDGGSRNSENIYRICSRAQDLTPAECYNEMAATGKDISSHALKLCPHYQIN